MTNIITFIKLLGFSIFMQMNIDDILGYSRVYLDTGFILGPGINASNMGKSLCRWQDHIPSLTSLIESLDKNGKQVRVVPETLTELRRNFVRNYHGHHGAHKRGHSMGNAGRAYAMLWEFYGVLEVLKEKAPKDCMLYGPIREFSRIQSKRHNPEHPGKIKADDVVLAHFLYSSLVEGNPTCMLTTDYNLSRTSISSCRQARGNGLNRCRDNSRPTSGVLYFFNDSRYHHTKV